MPDLLQLMKDYGFVAEGTDGNVYRRPNKPNTEIYVRTNDGWLLYQRTTSGMDPDAPVWGLEDETFPGFMLLPYSQKEEFKDIAGLHPSNPDHASFFQWYWTDAKLEEIFAHSIKTAPEGQAWVKQSDEEGNVTGYRLVPAQP